MKLLYVVPDPNRIGGVSRSISRVTKQLIDMGNKVSVYSPIKSTANGKPISELIQMRDFLNGKLMQDWTDKICREIEKVNPDILVGYYGSTIGYCTTVAAKLYNLPVVASMRGNDINRDFFSSYHASKLQYTIDNATVVTTVSSEMKAKVKVLLNGNATFIPNSVDKDIYKYDEQSANAFRKKYDLDHTPIIGLFGEIKDSRGIELLSQINKALEQYQILIIGKVRPESKNKIPENIKVIPYINDTDELIGAYSICDVILQPSRFDGMPNVVLEAMACQRIVIASPVGGIKDLITDKVTGYLCKEPDEWIKAIHESITKNDTSMGIKARESISNPEEEASSYLQIFENILSKK